MHPTLQLLERLESELATHTIHWFDLPEKTPLVKPTDKQFSLSWSESNQAQLDINLWPTSDYNILFYPKAKNRLDWWLASIAPSLKPEQKLWVIGENNGGIKSLPKRVSDFFECFKIDSARHCFIYELVPKNTLPNLPTASSFAVRELTCITLPGVFSAGHLDRGTEVLLSVLPQLKGDVLEFGGGCGVITSTIAKQQTVKQVDSVENDLLAVRSSLKTFELNNLNTKATCTWSNGTQQLTKKRYDAIVTNPPFHKGTRTDYGPSELFFSQAHEWIKSGGKLIWVVNEFLTYQHLLKDHFHTAEILAHPKGFIVYSATRK